MAANRSGVLCVGSIVVDLAKVIDAYPDQERLTLIRDVSVSTGGPALNLAVDENWHQEIEHAVIWTLWVAILVVLASLVAEWASTSWRDNRSIQGG